MAGNIDFNYLNKEKETFLFMSTMGNHLDYLCKLLEKVNTIKIDICNNNELTFFDMLILRKQLNNTNHTKKLIRLLEKLNYNFNRTYPSGRTFLTLLLDNITTSRDCYYEIMTLESYDIAIESEWLYLLSGSNITLHNYVNHMFRRKNYENLVLRLYKNLINNVWSNRFILFLKKAKQLHPNKLIECLNYKDDNGNTLIHVMAESHDKITLQYTINCFKDRLIIKPNNDGKTPLMLYEESNFKNILSGHK